MHNCSSKTRRQFLKSALIGGGAAAVAVASGTVVAAAPADKKAPERRKPESRGYRETEHVREYYKTAEF
jgi:hypothetical protein